MRKKLLCTALVLLFLCASLPLSACADGKALTVLDGSGAPFASLSSAEWQGEASDPALGSYLEIVLEEAILALADENGVSREKAEADLFRRGYVLHTAFEPKIFEAMKKGVGEGGAENTDFASACTDLKGNLVAAVSYGEKNFVTAKTQPYSAFKPLSVYMQALERGIINWSTTYVDEPVKKIVGEDGREYDWPANASNSYTYNNTPISVAVMQSLNTVASACLIDVGVANSVVFLKQNFGISMPTEEMRMNLVGADEIIGNLSMGHLFEGVSPLDMAGFYQCFANGGVYTPPRALQKITLGDEVVYERVTEEKRVMTEANAHIMNRLLQLVVSPGGTGKNARLEGVKLGGKTGTGDNGNWFVGFTPEYSCSVWHGSQIGENRAAKLFSQIFSKVEHNRSAEFPESSAVKEGIYCKKTGLLYSSGCMEADVGCYETGKMPVFCKE